MEALAIHLPPIGFTPIHTVCAVTTKSKPTIYRWIKNGTFPAPVRLGPNSVGFRVEEIRAWLASPNCWKQEGKQ